MAPCARRTESAEALGGFKHLKRAEGPLLEIGIPAQAIVEPIATLRDALDEMLDSNAGQVIVVDTDGSYTGVVDLEALISSIRRMRSDAKEHYEKLHLTGESPVVPPGGVVSP